MLMFGVSVVLAEAIDGECLLERLVRKEDAEVAARRDGAGLRGLSGRRRCEKTTEQNSNADEMS